MNTSEFLNILEHQKLVPGPVLEKLRAKAKKDSDRVTPKAVLKYLVKKDIVPREVAYQLLRTTLTVSPNAESSILGFVPLPQTPPTPDLPSKETRTDSRRNKRIEQLDEENAESSNIFDTGEPQPPPPPPGASSLASLSDAKRAESEQHAIYDEVVQEPRKKSKSKSRRKKKESEWDSSLILYGGGGLIVLLLTGGVIYYLLNRENAEVVLQQARDFFEGGSYTQAINQYEHFVKTFPNDPQSSIAKVQLGTARLWKATTNTNDYVAALDTARDVLEQIEDEEEFDQAHRDLASLLPKIATGLADQAEEATDLDLAQERVGQTRQALSLYMNTKYVPTNFRDESMLNEVDQALLRVERNREQSLDLQKTLAAIDEALAAQKITDAYNLRADLLEKHPALIHDELLAKKVQEISAAEAAVVAFVEQSQPAATGSRESPIIASLALAERSVSLEADAPGAVAFRVGGAVYGLEAGDGNLLWREYLGIDPRSIPLRLDQGDFLVSDHVHHELAKLDAASGKTQWRCQFESDILQPVVDNNICYVAETSGKLHAIDLADGTRTGYWQFGQRLAAQPTIDSREKLLYVVGEHSSLYTLSLSDRSCLGVHYLGHRAGEIEVPVVKILSKLIVAINRGLSTSELQVLALDASGMAVGLDTSRRLKGIIDTGLVTAGRRVVALTNRGQINVFEVVATEGEKALSSIAEHDIAQGDSISQFGLLADSNLWVAGRKLSKLEVMATGNRVQVRDLENDFFGDTFDHPLVATGGLIIHARHPANQAGMIVAATRAEDGKVVWQTELAVPLAGEPVVDSSKGNLSAITASGAAYQLDREAMARRVQDQSSRLPASRRAGPVFQTCVDLQGGVLAAGEVGKDFLAHYRPSAERNPMSRIGLPSPLATELVAWREGFVAPLAVGQVYYFGAQDGAQVGSPFQPPLSPGDSFRWVTPAVAGEGAESLLAISDGVEKVYLLKLVQTPEPHLEVAAEQALEGNPVETRLAASGDLLVGGTSSGGLACFTLPALTPRETIALGGRVTWGPYAHAEGILLATDQGELVAISAAGDIQWKVPMAEKKPVGKPLVEGENLLVAWQREGISRLAISDGSEQATVVLEQALATGPISFGRRLLAVADDGTLLITNSP